jgi:hypothetical protein
LNVALWIDFTFLDARIARSQQRMYVQSRSSYAVYFNCRDCHETIVLAKPRG